MCPPAGDPVEDYRNVRLELQQYSPSLAKTREIVVVNKMDLTGSDRSLRRFEEALGVEVSAISAATGRNLEKFAETVWRVLQEDQ